MASIQTKDTGKVLQIRKWLGVNECPDGDTNIRIGEAAVMRNCRPTKDGSLRKRPGTQNVANLLFNSDIDIGGETIVKTEINTTTAVFSMYPSYDITDGGVLYLKGTPVNVNAGSASSYADYCWQNAAGNIYRFSKCEVITSSTGTHVTGGSVNVGAQFGFTTNIYYPFNAYSDIAVSNGAIVPVGATTNIDVGRYFLYNGLWCKFISSNSTGYALSVYAYPITFQSDDVWNWWFYHITLVPNTTDSQVRGIWSGRVGSNEAIYAACNNRLWRLSADAAGAWAKTSVGTLNTDRKVSMFGFDGKLYVLNGSSYMVYDGTTLASVIGYRPLVHVARSYDGAQTTTLERVNMLNGLRRVWFSPDGTHSTFTLPENGLASINYVKSLITGNALTISSFDLTNGTVTLSAAPAAGTSSIEIGYTASATFRSTINAMTRAELYNGSNDNRIFFYGDGSNKAYYSDIDHDARPTAEYIPDLNVVDVGDANTPIYDMLRHYNELMVFKEGSSHRIRFGDTVLPDGTVTATFYVETINKELGGSGYGQAQLVDNHPRTLDGRSIYAWIATTSAGNITTDQRNAQRISQKVETTIRSLDLLNAVAFYDKINHEYYVVQNGTAIVQNTETGAWYIYTGFPAICFVIYKDDLYFGTEDGYIRRVSYDYMHDCGNAIDCHCESGAMDFGSPEQYKSSDYLYIQLKPDDNSSVYVSVQTDRDNSALSRKVESGLFSFVNFNFVHFTFNTNSKPQTSKLKFKVKKFVYYKLIIDSNTADTTFTITSAEIKINYLGFVR